MLKSVAVGACLASGAAGLPTGYPSVPINGIDGKVAMPMVGLGTWEYNSTVAGNAITAAFEVGYRHVDTALGYKNQPGVGTALSKQTMKREQYFVTTKIPGGLNASATAAALDQCLDELQLEYVDLMLLHWPGNTIDSVKEQWTALEKWAKGNGKRKARSIGVSHYCKTQLQAVYEIATLPVAVNQNQYHVGMGKDTQPRLHDKDYAVAHDTLYEAYSSLCGPCPDPWALINGSLVTSIGKAHKKTGAQVALKWVVQQGIPIIPKSTNPKHLKENFEMFDFELTKEEMEKLTAANYPPETGTPQAPDDAQDCASEEPHPIVV